MAEQGFQYQFAIQDFRQARRKASLEQILSFITGKSADLLSFEDVIKTLKITGSSAKQLKEIPLDAIVGSVGRYADFTRSFFPKQNHDEHRWVNVQQVITGLGGAPPIDVYQVGETYFVIDGNHRVSVARRLGTEFIEAYVTQIRTAIPLTPDTQPDDLIIKAEYKTFLQHVRLDELRPGSDFSVTVPGKYTILERQIATHCFSLIDHDHILSLDDAIRDWYDTVYLPVIQVIRERGILRDFPDRTETDLYLWISEHRAELEKQLGWKVAYDKAATDLVDRFSPRPKRIISRVGKRLSEVFTPDELESGPPVGQWRREEVAARRHDCLFPSLLVPISGEERGWCALEQAIEIAQHEEGQIYGLHIVPSENRKTSKEVLAISTEFARRCKAAGIQGEFAIETGDIPRKISERARWTDLAVINLLNPPGSEPISRLKSPFRTIIRQCSRPILAVPKVATKMNRALLAYDGSPKADEALFVSAYLAARWGSSLVVVTVVESEHSGSEILTLARKYLNMRGVNATFVQKTGAVSETILDTAEEYESDLIIMGGYGYSPVLEVVLGSKIEYVLRNSPHPMLICR